MDVNLAGYNAQSNNIATRANAMYATLVRSQFDEHGVYLNDDTERNQSIADAVAVEPIYAAMGDHGLETAMIHIQAVKEYQDMYGVMPDNMLLASAHQAMENLFVTAGVAAPKNDKLFASVQNSMATSAGVPIVVTTAQVTLPVLLATPTLDFTTFLPAARTEELEIFEVHNIAGSDFGDYKKGQVITPLSSGQYSDLCQIFDFKVEGDGEAKEFAFNTATDTPATKKLHMKAGSVVVYINKDQASVDQKDGKLYGSVTQGGKEILVTGTINYSEGTVAIVSAVALADKSTISIEFQVDIESQPDLIPEINQKATSFKIRPNERVLRTSSTIQSMYKLGTELGIDARSLALTSLRDHLAADYAVHMLRKVYWHAKKDALIDVSPKENSNDTTHDRHKLVRHGLQLVSDGMMTSTKESGLRGIFCSREQSAFFKGLDSDSFKYTPNYQQTNKIHFVGVAFGQYRIYEVPFEGLIPTGCNGLGYGKTPRLGKAPYYAGDINPPMLIDSNINEGLVKSDTVWAKGFSAINPDGGSDYFHKITIIGL